MNSLISSQLIRYVRKQKQLKIDELAELSNYSNRYISEIEIGQKKVSIDTLKAILNSMNVDFHEEIDLEDELNEIVDLYIDRDYSYVDRLKRVIDKEENYYSNSFHIVLLSEYIYKVYSHDFYALDKIKIYLDRMMSGFNCTQKLIYYIFQSIEAEDNHELSTLEEVIDEGISIRENNRLSCALLGVLFSYKSLLKFNKNILDEALIYSLKAKRKLESSGSYLKMLNVQVKYINILICMKNFEKAEKEIEETIKLAGKLASQNTIIFCVLNKIVLYYRSNQFEKCLSLCNEYLGNDEYDQAHLYFYKILTYYRLKQLDRAKEMVFRFRESFPNDDEYNLYWYGLLNGILNEKEISKSIGYLEKYLIKIKTIYDLEELYIICITYYERKQMYKEAFEYSSKCLALNYQKN